MSRRRGPGSPRRYADKAGASDVDVFAGTIADANSQKMPDQEQYYLLFRKQPWVRACIRIIGNAVTQEGYDLVPTDDDTPLDPEDERLEAIQNFMRTGFIGKFNSFRKFVKAVVIDQQTYGVGYARRKYGRVDGRPTLVALERLDARRMVPHLNGDKTAIEYFTLRKTQNSVNSAVEQAAQQLLTMAGAAGEKIDAKEVIMFSTDEGGDDILPSASPLEALELTLAMDMNIRQHRNSFFRNGAVSGNVLINKTVNQNGMEATVKKLNAQNVGPRNAYKNMILAGDWDVKTLISAGRQDLDFVNGTEIMIEEVCAVYSVPPSKLRDVSGSMGQAGKGEDDDTFEQECILPIEENFYETLTRELLIGEWDIQDIAFSPKRRNKIRLERFNSAALAVKFGATGNEARDLVGLPKSEVDGMDIPLFIGATGAAGVADDEAVGKQQAQSEQTEDAQATEVNRSGDEDGGDQGVAKNRTAKKARRPY
jgi:Phage portal protein